MTDYDGDDRRLTERREIRTNAGLQVGPIIAALIASAVSVVGSLLFVINMLIHPVETQISQLNTRSENLNTRMVEVMQRIGTKPRAAADVAKLYSITDALRKDVDRCYRMTKNYMP